MVERLRESTVEYLDISMPIRPGMPQFPGDPPVAVRPLTVSDGSSFGLSELQLGSHAGTHIDPPRHFVPGAPTVDALPPEQLNGPCEVVELPSSRRFVAASDLPDPDRGAERLLFKTANSGRWAAGEPYFPDYVAMTADCAREVVRRRMRMVGVDALSVENDPTGRYPVHRVLLGAGVAVLEGLLLNGVAPGRYELLCLPLRLEAGDGAPARAFLRRT